MLARHRMTRQCILDLQGRLLCYPSLHSCRLDPCLGEAPTPPADTMAALREAREQLDAGRSQPAVQRLTSLLLDEPATLPELYLLLAEAYADLGEEPEALTIMDLLAGALGDPERLALARGVLAYRQRHYARAREIFRGATRRLPRNLLGWIGWVETETDAGQPREAVLALDHAMDHHPRNPWLMYLFTRLTEPVKATAILKTLVQWLPDVGEICNDLAVHLAAEKERLAEAEELARRALKAMPEWPETYDTLGWVLARSGRRQEARPLLESAARMLPDHPEIRAHLASIDQGEN